MAAATWRYRGDPEAERPAALVRFANGKLQHPDSLRFTVYRNRDTAHPRKRHRRILVSETERLCYVGHNFGSEVMKCNSLCRYFVGVLDKNSGQMEVYNAEIFNMQPLLSDNLIPDDTKDYQTKSYREKMDLCIEAFGTSKQKRALSSRRMNAVGNDIVSTAVTKAAANVIDAKGVTVLSPAEYEALRVPAATLANITAEELAKGAEERSHCSFVLEELKFLPTDEKSRDHKARCLWFLDTLIKFSHLKVIKKKRKRVFSS
ncbi:hypothetical protein DUI87_15118 [Hirundo rustica rustica]|uniref:Uncharacterized protein n=1 Tax=Hirundo rustica rustica TaxID=333673 RepID=A0A3M0KLL2_HIRRU|nr:hypothetical protein DUI87_15118 [Hirundo rustica rustica]